MNKEIKCCIFLILVLINLNLSAQERKSFFVVDTITLKEPVLFNFQNYDGEFITESKVLKKNRNKRKLIKEGLAFIYSEDFYYYLNKDEFESYNYPNKGNCRANKRAIKRADKSSIVATNRKKFILCMIDASFYNEKTSTADIGKTFYHKSKKGFYYRIVFPLCK